MLARVFAVDVLTCPTCGATRRLIAVITAPRVIRSILERLGLPPDPATGAGARGAIITSNQGLGAGGDVFDDSMIAAHRQTSTGIVLCVRTLVVSLPSTRAETPLRPCEAMQIKSHCLSRAVAMIARCG